MIQRACVGLDQATDQSLGNPIESQTLSMGMGLVATLLSGPKVLITENSAHRRVANIHLMYITYILNNWETAGLLFM